MAQQGYFEDPKFIAYLEYLRYLEQPEYAAFIRYDDNGIIYFHNSYPNGLLLLKMLQSVSFREQLRDPDCTNYIHRQQYYSWLNNNKVNR